MNLSEMTLKELSELRNQLGVEILSRIWPYLLAFLLVVSIWTVISYLRKRR